MHASKSRDQSNNMVLTTAHNIFFSSREIYGKLLQKGEPTVEIKCPFGAEYDTSIIMSFKKNVVTGGFG